MRPSILKCLISTILVVVLPSLAAADDCGQKTKVLRFSQAVRYQLVLTYVDNEVNTYFNTARSDVRENGTVNVVYELNDRLIPEADNVLRILGFNEGLAGTPHSNPGRIDYSIIRNTKVANSTKTTSSVILSSRCDHPDNQSPSRRDMFDHTYNITFNSLWSGPCCGETVTVPKKKRWILDSRLCVVAIQQNFRKNESIQSAPPSRFIRQAGG